MTARSTEIVEALLKDGHAVQKTVLGDSMLPTVGPEARVRIEPVSGGRVRLGEVVLFRAVDGRTKIHRVAMLFRRDGERFVQAWGDNCRVPDPPVPVQRIMGRVTACSTETGWRPLPGRKAYVRFFAARYAPHYLKNLPGVIANGLASGFPWPLI